MQITSSRLKSVRSESQTTERLNTNGHRRMIFFSYNNIVHVDLFTVLLALVILFRQDVGNVVPRVAIQTLFQTLLIHVMTNKADAPS